MLDSPIDALEKVFIDGERFGVERVSAEANRQAHVVKTALGQRFEVTFTNLRTPFAFVRRVQPIAEVETTREARSNRRLRKLERPFRRGVSRIRQFDTHHRSTVRSGPELHCRVTQWSGFTRGRRVSRTFADRAGVGWTIARARGFRTDFRIATASSFVPLGTSDEREK